MNTVLNDIDEEILNDILFLSSEEQSTLLEFLAKEIIFSLQASFNVKVADVKLLKIFSFILTGSKIWSGKTIYTDSELENVLDLYDRAPAFVQEKLEPLMKEFKEEIFGSLE